MKTLWLNLRQGGCHDGAATNAFTKIAPEAAAKAGVNLWSP
jgi:hypothetical protein